MKDTEASTAVLSLIGMVVLIPLAMLIGIALDAWMVTIIAGWVDVVITTREAAALAGVVTLLTMTAKKGDDTKSMYEVFTGLLGYYLAKFILLGGCWLYLVHLNPA